MEFLSYHTSITQEPKKDTELLKKLSYHTSIQSKEILLDNLSRHRLKETDIFTLAYLASNEVLEEEDREKYKYQLLKKLEENN
jgi:hypothetical protein